MKIIDKLLQKWRLKKTIPWIPTGSRVLDIGCHHGELFEYLRDRIGQSFGLDPLAEHRMEKNYIILRESFEGLLHFNNETFDVIVMLATIEHIPNREELIKECFRVLDSNGIVIITVPSPHVDPILDLLVRLRIADGMSLDQHNGFDPSYLIDLFRKNSFFIDHLSKFQFGLNNLMVFRKGI